MKQFGTGALKSQVDPRTVKHEDVVMAGVPLIKGGIEYLPTDIDHQHHVGICTAISLTQNRQKANGKKYSPEFQYLLQKKFYDLNWTEGSSIFYALKVGKQYGFLPAELWTYTTENDRFLPYTQYIAKLQAVPDSEVQRLIGLCVDKIPGYASVDVTSPQKLAQAINDSEAGILCMYRTGSTWYTPSWLPKDIDPIRKPLISDGGHAITMNMFDYTIPTMHKLANTWGTNWDYQGCANINWDNYSMLEAWSILRVAPLIPPFIFTKNLWLGMKNGDVLMLQKRLGVVPKTSFFGTITLGKVVQYQKANGITPTGFVGPITRAKLNT